MSVQFNYAALWNYKQYNHSRYVYDTFIVMLIRMVPFVEPLKKAETTEWEANGRRT